MTFSHTAIISVVFLMGVIGLAHAQQTRQGSSDAVQLPQTIEQARQLGLPEALPGMTYEEYRAYALATLGMSGRSPQTPSAMTQDYPTNSMPSPSFVQRTTSPQFRGMPPTRSMPEPRTTVAPRSMSMSDSQADNPALSSMTDMTKPPSSTRGNIEVSISAPTPAQTATLISAPNFFLVSDAPTPAPSPSATSQIEYYQFLIEQLQKKEGDYSNGEPTDSPTPEPTDSPTPEPTDSPTPEPTYEIEPNAVPAPDEQTPHPSPASTSEQEYLKFLLDQFKNIKHGKNVDSDTNASKTKPTPVPTTSSVPSAENQSSIVSDYETNVKQITKQPSSADGTTEDKDNDDESSELESLKSMIEVLLERTSSLEKRSTSSADDDDNSEDSIAKDADVVSDDDGEAKDSESNKSTQEKKKSSKKKNDRKDNKKTSKAVNKKKTDYETSNETEKPSESEEDPATSESSSEEESDADDKTEEPAKNSETPIADKAPGEYVKSDNSLQDPTKPHTFEVDGFEQAPNPPVTLPPAEYSSNNNTASGTCRVRADLKASSTWSPYAGHGTAVRCGVGQLLAGIVQVFEKDEDGGDVEVHYAAYCQAVNVQCGTATAPLLINETTHYYTESVGRTELACKSDEVAIGMAVNNGNYHIECVKWRPSNVDPAASLEYSVSSPTTREGEGDPSSTAACRSSALFVHSSKCSKTKNCEGMSITCVKLQAEIQGGASNESNAPTAHVENSGVQPRIIHRASKSNDKDQAEVNGGRFQGRPENRAGRNN